MLAAITENQARNAMIVDICAHEVEQGNQAIVLSHRREHCSMLDMLLTQRSIKTGLMLGGSTGKATFAETAEGIRAGTTMIAVGTLKAIGQGIDLPSVSVGVVTTPIHTNEGLFKQVRGRICRASSSTNKSGARLYVMWDRDIAGRKLLDNLLKWNPTAVLVLHEEQWVPAARFISAHMPSTRRR
jgi:superfamily II DNA or RNA helicase